MLQVRVPARWAEASRMASDVDHYQFDLSTIDVFNNAFTPSMTPYSPLVFGKKVCLIECIGLWTDGKGKGHVHWCAVSLRLN